MSDWFHDAHFGDLYNTAGFSGKYFPVFQNRTGFPVKITNAYLSGNLTASSSAYFLLILADSAGNTIVSKDLASLPLTYTTSTSMGTVSTTYQVVNADETIYLLFTQGGVGCSMPGLYLRLDGEILRGG